MRHIVSIVFGLLLLAALGTACKSKKNVSDKSASAAAPAADLVNTRWVLRTLATKPVTQPERGEVFLILRTEGNKAEGFSGCNSYNSIYKLEDGKLSLGPIMSTKMFCGGDNPERGFMEALRSFDTHKIDGQKLLLYKESQELAQLEAVYLK